jgi:hypothetical protein
MRLRTVALSAIFALGPTFAWGFDLKGVELGKFASHEQLHAALGIPCLLQKCGVGRTTIAGISCDTSVAFNDEKNVDKIVATFSFSGFQDVRDALVNKYGSPTQQASQPMVTGNGLKLTRWTGVWRDSDGNELALVQYSDALHGQLSLRTKARIESEKQRAKEI